MRWAVLLVLASCGDRFTPIEPAVDAGPDAANGDASSGHEEHDGGACDTVGRTGGSDTCVVFAYCGHRHFELDCSARFTCVCSEPEVDGGATKQIAAQPVYCESPITDLAAAFESARRACDW